MNIETISTEETWLPIDGYLQYEVSDHGRVRNAYGKIMKSHLNNCGYFNIQVSMNNSKRSFLTHRLVAIAFIPNPDSKPQVNHKDGNPKNNNVENLEWVTARENLLHAYKMGLDSNRGSRNPISKLTEVDILVIRSLIESGQSGSTIGKRFGVSRFTINKIGSGITWAHVA